MAAVNAAAAEAPPAEPAGPSPFELKAPYYAKRIELFETYFAREGDKQAAAAAAPDPIQARVVVASLAGVARLVTRNIWRHHN
jgi:hypothetical protein